MSRTSLQSRVLAAPGRNLKLDVVPRGLSSRPDPLPNPTVWRRERSGRGGETTVTGLVVLSALEPRVAPASQPSTEGCNPFGIGRNVQTPARLAKEKGRRLSDVGLRLRTLLSCLAAALVLQPDLLRACAACYGQSDSPMAAGMNWGILSLLVVVGCVLGGVTAFFVYLARRSATALAVPANPKPRRASVPVGPDFGGFPDQLRLAGTLALPRSTGPLFDSTPPML
jgi:hypothetical protein